MRKKDFISYSPKIEYIGDVKMSLLDKSGRVISIETHNDGKDALFKYIAMSLCGIDVHERFPRKLDIINHETKDSIITSSGKIDVRDKKYVYNNGWYCVLRFTINRSQILDPTGTIDLILLGGDRGDEAYAVVDGDNHQGLPSSMIQQLVAGTTLYIEWSLTVRNVTKAS